MIARFQDLWVADDHVAVHRALFDLGDCRDLSVEEILSLFELPPIWRERFSAVYEMRLSTSEVIHRRRHEDLVWALGEALRQVLKGKKERRDLRIASAIAAICRDTSYKKGRESFVMLFGDLQLKGFSSLLVDLIDDPEVVGHAIFSLRRLKVAEPHEKIARLVDHPKPWIRKEVRKYLEKIA